MWRARGTARDRKAPHRFWLRGRPLCALETPETATGRRLPSCRATSARACAHPDTPRPALVRPSFLVDIARAWPHEATAYCGAGQANPAVCSAPTRSQRSPAARWSRIVHEPRVVKKLQCLAATAYGGAHPAQRGRNLIVFLHSSASMVDQMSSTSSTAVAIGSRCGIISTPGLVAVAMNAAKCLGIVF